MTRAFTASLVATDVVDRVLAAGDRAPSAGNTGGWAWLVLEGADETQRYWDATLPADRRDGFPWPGLLDAPVLVVPLCRPEAWPERYAEVDKVRTGLGESTDAWAAPYWWIDTAMAAMLVQLAAIDEGLGVCFFGQFDHEPAVLEAFGVPDDWRALGTLALGHPAPDRPSSSAGRAKPPTASRTHRGSW